MYNKFPYLELSEEDADIAMRNFLSYYAISFEIKNDQIPFQTMTGAGAVQGRQIAIITIDMHLLKKLVYNEQIGSKSTHEEHIRNTLPAAKLAWEHYQTILKLSK